MNKRIGALGVIFLITQLGKAQTKSPNVSQVLMYSTATPSQTVPTFTGPSFQLPQAVPSVFTETAQQATLFTQTQPNLRNPTNFCNNAELCTAQQCSEREYRFGVINYSALFSGIWSYREVRSDNRGRVARE